MKKIICMYPENINSAWSASTGVADELERAGHEVLRVPLLIDPEHPGELPELTALQMADAIVLLGPEHYHRMLDGKYSFARWAKLSTPKLAWYHESAFRDDRQCITAGMLPYADEHHFPAAQDADFFDQAHFAAGRTRWLPFGVDCHVFNPGVMTEKKYPMAFIGGRYAKRMEFVIELARGFKDNENFLMGNVLVQDLAGYQPRKTVEVYAQNLREISVFINLPSLSRLLVTKIFETLACGACLVTPTLTGEGHANLKLFKNHQHLEYYSEKNPAHAAELARQLLASEPRRATMAFEAWQEISQKHSLKHRVRELLASVVKDELAMVAS